MPGPGLDGIGDIHDHIARAANSFFHKQRSSQSIGQQVPGAVSGIDIIRAEPLGIGHAALVATILGAGANHIGKVDVVMLQHPLQLRLMSLQCFDFSFNLISYIHIMGRLKINACQGVHKENRYKTVEYIISSGPMA